MGFTVPKYWLNKQLVEAVAEIFSDKRREKSVAQETLVDELYKQIGQLTVGRDWLKKNKNCYIIDKGRLIYANGSVISVRKQ